jgi:hypothetical protein
MKINQQRGSGCRNTNAPPPDGNKGHRKTQTTLMSEQTERQWERDTYISPSSCPSETLRAFRAMVWKACSTLIASLALEEEGTQATEESKVCR